MVFSKDPIFTKYNHIIVARESKYIFTEKKPETGGRPLGKVLGSGKLKVES